MGIIEWSSLVMAVGTMLGVFFVWRSDLKKRFEKDNDQDQRLTAVEVSMDSMKESVNILSKDISSLLHGLSCGAHSEALSSLAADNVRLDTMVDRANLQSQETVISVSEISVEIKNINGMVKGLRGDFRANGEKLSQLIAEIAVISSKV